MSAPDPKADARLALLCLAAEDAYDAAGGRSGAALLDIPADPRLAPEWAVRGHIVGTDALLRPRAALALGTRQVWYGWLLESTVTPGGFAAVIRGTDGLIEWAEDAEFVQVRHPRAGRVEAGFWGIYSSLQFRRPGGPNVPLVAALTAIAGAGHLTVTGHSLGAALATYLATDLAEPAQLGGRVALRHFASPHPGDGLFAQYAGARIADARGYARELDVVPRVPFGFEYAPPPSTIRIPPDAFGVRVRFGVREQHHVLSYAVQLDPDCVDLKSLPPIDAPYVAAIILPAVQAAA